MSDPVKRDPILDQFSMITRPYTRPNGLKKILFPAAHTRIANIWEYSPPRVPLHCIVPTTFNHTAKISTAESNLFSFYFSYRSYSFHIFRVALFPDTSLLLNNNYIVLLLNVGYVPFHADLQMAQDFQHLERTHSSPWTLLRRDWESWL